MKSSLFITLVALFCLFIAQNLKAEELKPINVFADAEAYSTQINIQGKTIVGLKSWTQALSQLPGAYIYNDGGLKLSFQGGYSHQIAVIIDGVLVEDSSSPNKTFNFNSLSLDNIKSIKVLNAVESSFSVGSPFVVELETYGTNKVRLEGGSYGFASIEAQSSSKKSKSYLKVESQDGVSAASGKDTENDGKKNIYGSYDKDKKYGFRANILDEEIDRGGGLLNDDPNYTLKQEQYGAYHNLNFNKVQSELSINFNKRKAENKKDKLSIVDESSRYQSVNLGHSFHGEIFNTNYKLSSFYEQTKIRTVFGGVRSRINNEKNYSSRLSLLKAFKTKNRTLNLSLWSDYDNLISESGGYALLLKQQLGVAEFSAAYSRGLKKPTLSQLFDPNYGNEKLKEELNYFLDVSLTSYLDSLTAKIYYKKQNVDELISFDSLTLKSKNISKAKLESLGVDFRTSNKNFAFGVGGDYILKAKNGEGEKLNRRPQWSVNAFLSTQFIKSMKAGLIYKNIGSRYDLDLNNFTKQIKLKNYKNLDLYLEKSLLAYQAYIKINNIFNDKTESINGYAVPGTQVFVGIAREF